MHKLIAFAAALALLAAAPASAATTAQKAAVAALISAERAPTGIADVEQPSCLIVQTYAQCGFAIERGGAEKTAWLHLKNGKWIFLGDLGEKYYDNGIMKYGSAALMLEKQYGIPASVAKQFTGPGQHTVP